MGDSYRDVFSLENSCDFSYDFSLEKSQEFSREKTSLYESPISPTL